MQNSLESFYEENKEFLLKSYPGLKSKRLIQEYQECSGISVEDFKIKILTAIPLEYISNVSYFYKSKFFVDNRVLIPRGETEILVEESINFIRENNVKSVYEIGVGSGCISISIALECPFITICGSDISLDALEVANRNANLNSVDIMFEHQDLISDNKYNFIVSNPPYIKSRKDRESVHFQTEKFEPHLALFIEDEQYDNWFERLFELSSASLLQGGAFFMEGHEDSLEDLRKMALNYFNKVDIVKDYSQRQRFIFCYKE